MGRVDHYHARTRGDGAGKRLEVDAVIGQGKRQAHRRGASEPNRGVVAVVGRIEKDYLVANADCRLNCIKKRLGGA